MKISFKHSKTYVVSEEITADITYSTESSRVLIVQ